jgi:hypothetical protein
MLADELEALRELADGIGHTETCGRCPGGTLVTGEDGGVLRGQEGTRGLPWQMVLGGHDSTGR